MEMRLGLSRFVVTALSCFIFMTVAGAGEKFSCMGMNIWQNGTHVSSAAEKTADIIAEIKPDVVSFSESREDDWGRNLVKILKARGLSYQAAKCGGDVGIISRYPVKSSKLIFRHTNSAAAFVLDVGGKELLILASHLDYRGYASNLPRGYNAGSESYKGWKKMDKKVTDQAEILRVNRESRREEQIKAVIAEAVKFNGPCFIIGDFNEPSYLDWTERTKNMFEHNGAVVEWPCTRMLSDAGFTDVFRELYPDEVKNPGITWPSKFEKGEVTTWAPESDDRDRVDYIFYRGSGISALKFAVVGPKESYAYNKVTTSGAENDPFLASGMPWPTDHKAVYAEFIIETAE